MIEPPVALDPESLVGSTLGSYRLVRLIGCGGMGWVFEGLQEVIGARVAIKVLDPEVASAPAVVERFFNEARAVNLIGHRNLVRILDLAHQDGCHYLVMELLEGRPLSALLGSGRPMPLAEAAPILMQCADALGAAHERGIVHRDVKPDNIFVVAEPGQAPLVKILDFGVAKLAIDGRTTRTAVGVVMGTPAYMSPEQAEGAVDRIDGRSDVYALGVVMFQMATGALPFDAPTGVRMLVAHATVAPPRPTLLVPETPAAFEAIILRCLAKAPQDRFQTMRELRDALAAALAQGAAGAGAVRPAPPPLPSAPPVIPAYGGGLDGEPLPGAEMFDPPPVADPARPGPAPTAPPQRISAAEEPIELDLPAAAAVPDPAAGAPEAPATGSSGWTFARRALRVVAGLAMAGCAAGLAFLVWGQLAGPQPVVVAAAPGTGEVGCPAEATPVAARSVELQVVTDPARARVRATWDRGGCAEGVTPWRLTVPRGARVSLRYRLAGRPDRQAEVVADNPQVVLEAFAP